LAIDPVAVQLGPVSIYWYGITMTTAFILGTALAYHYATKSKIDPEHILNMLIFIIPAGIIGARLFYVIFNWSYYQNNPSEIIAIWHGGLSIHGSLAGGLLAGYLYIKKYKLDFWQVGDIFAPSIILGQAIGRWGNFFNQEAFGGPVSKEFISRFPEFIQNQMFIGGRYHHPTFLYESLWNLLVFIFLVIFRPYRRFHGQLILLYIGLYSAGRFFVEGIRSDSLMWGPFRAAQVASLVLIGLAVYGLFRLRTKSAGEEQEEFATEDTEK